MGLRFRQLKRLVRLSIQCCLCIKLMSSLLRKSDRFLCIMLGMTM
jgi:hypothetical protein